MLRSTWTARSVFWSKSNPAALNERIALLSNALLSAHLTSVFQWLDAGNKKAAGKSAELWIFLLNGNTSKMIKIDCFKNASPQCVPQEDAGKHMHYAQWYISHFYIDIKKYIGHM